MAAKKILRRSLVLILHAEFRNKGIPQHPVPETPVPYTQSLRHFPWAIHANRIPTMDFAMHATDAARRSTIV